MLWPAASVLILDTIGTVSLPFSFLLSCLSVSVLVSHAHSVSVVLMQAVSHSCKLTPFSRTHTLTLAFMLGFMKRVERCGKCDSQKKYELISVVNLGKQHGLFIQTLLRVLEMRMFLSSEFGEGISHIELYVQLQRKVRKSFFRGRSESLAHAISQIPLA